MAERTWEPTVPEPVTSTCRGEAVVAMAEVKQQRRQRTEGGTSKVSNSLARGEQKVRLTVQGRRPTKRHHDATVRSSRASYGSESEQECVV